MEIPSEVKIKATLNTGAVYYFPDEELKSTEPHYFIVLNHNPLNDHLLLLVCSSSKINKVKLRSKNFPSTTVVEVSKIEYTDFTTDSIVDCNYIFLRSVEQLIKKCDEGKLLLKSQMPLNILIKLRQGVIDSPSIPEAQKRILNQ